MATKSISAETMLKALKNPFEPRFVKYRVGATSKDKTKGIAVFYIDSREVQKRLDDICGIDGWQTKFLPTDKGVVCELSIRMPDGTWITKSDGGVYTEKITPFKGGCSDALKRAAVQFGIGRYLYYIPNQWYPIDKYKQFSVQPELPKWALPQPDLQDWEEVAIAEYDQARDIDLEYLDQEEQSIRKKSEERKAEIIANLKAKKS